MFSFNTPDPAKPADPPKTNTGFSFGAPTDASKPTTGFSFGAPAVASKPNTGLSFGAPADVSKPTTGLSFGAPADASKPNTGLSFGASAVASKPATGLSFGAPADASKPATGLSFGASADASKPTTGLSFGAPAVASKPATGFSFGASADASKPTTGLSFGAPAVASKPTTGLSFGAPADASKPTTGFGTTISKDNSSATEASKTVTFAPKSSDNPNVSVAKPDALLSKPETPGKPNPAVYSQVKNKTLEEILTRWTNQLDVQTREFHKQAMQIQSWDRTLLENRQQITKMHNLMQQAETLGAEINQNLEYIDAQQTQLESTLDNFELTLRKATFTKTAVDQDRENAYGLAEKLHKQLDDMSLQLSTVVEQLNSTRKVPTESPLDSITQILNEHLVSLEWLEKSSHELEQRIEVLQGIS